MNIEYRWIDGHDPAFNDVLRIVEERRWVLLNRDTSRALCAFIDGQLVGFHILQLFPHCEPLYVDPKHRATGIAESLADQMLNFMHDVNARGFMVIADNPHAIRMCEARGMKKVTSPVYLM